MQDKGGAGASSDVEDECDMIEGADCDAKEVEWTSLQDGIQKQHFKVVTKYYSIEN